ATWKYSGTGLERSIWIDGLTRSTTSPHWMVRADDLDIMQVCLVRLIVRMSGQADEWCLLPSQEALLEAVPGRAVDVAAVLERVPEAFERDHRGPFRQAECGGDGAVGRLDAVEQHLRGRPLAAAHEVVVQAGQFDTAADLRVHHAGAHTPLADQQALLDQVLDRPPHGRPGQAQLGGELQLVVEPVALPDLAGLDGALQVLSQLEVQ